MRIFISLLAVSSFFAQLHADNICPPWVYLQNEMRTSIGADPDIKVYDIDTTTFILRIELSDAAAAQALANIVTRDVPAGKQTILVRVYVGSSIEALNPQVLPSDPTLAQQMIQQAFAKNPHFAGFTGANSPLLQSFFILFKGTTQFYSDDINSAFGLSTLVAHQAFEAMCQFSTWPNLKIFASAPVEDDWVVVDHNRQLESTSTPTGQ